MRIRPRLLLLAAVLCVSSVRAEVTVTGLRVSGWENPLGLDDPRPVLSWRLESTDRGAAQSACRILVASVPELLSEGRADLWDSGRLVTPSPLGVAYAGRELASSQRVYWRVRVWDEKDVPSAWSPVGTWTAGVLRSQDWNPATRWITDPGLQAMRRARLGFRTPESSDPAQPEWLQVDLGEVRPIEAVRLHAVRHTVPERFGFPRRFKVELATRPDLGDARVIVDHTTKDFPNAWANVIRLPVEEIAGRYLRLTATGLRAHEAGTCLALSQFEVISDGHNVAVGRPVTASSSVEDERWSLAAAVDGLGVPGANPRANETLLLRKDFSVKPGLRRALLHVSGLGHYTLAVNGQPVPGPRLTPGWTNYERTVLYDTRDLTTTLRPGGNALGLTLAGGMYNVAEGRYVKFVTDFRPLTAWAELHLEYADGSREVVATDATWRAAPGPTTFANMYGGEDHDARREPAGWTLPEFDAGAWSPAAEDRGPAGTLRGAAHAAPPVRTHEVFPPAAVREIRPGVFVYDFGQNAAIMPRLRVTGPAGSAVRLIPAELLREDGSVDRRNVGGSAWWQYTLRGDAGGERWEPAFFYHGARYLQAELTAGSDGGLPRIEQLEALVVHVDAPAAGEFVTSNELFNRIHALVRWAQRSNLMHVLTDCPHRERLGWLEQYHLNGPALRYNWDLGRHFTKTFGDMADAQDGRGLVPGIAPEYVIFDGGFRDSPEWGSALILAAEQHARWTGDDAPLRRHYAAMQRYLAYLATRTVDGGILDHGLGDWYDLGPNRPGYAQLTPVALTATAIFYQDARTLAGIADRLGRNDDAAKYGRMADEIAARFNQRFLDPERGRYAGGSQTAQALPLVLGLVPPQHRAAVLGTLVRDIEERGHAITAGDVGYRYVLRALADAGRSDVIFRTTNQSDKPGYGYQLARGATSLTEAWDADRRASQNHFMLGQINEWFFHDLAGIQPDPAAPGFRRVVLAPAFLRDLDWVKASHRSPVGWIRSEWRRSEGRVAYAVTIPPGATASVRLPVPAAGDIRESGRDLAGHPHVRIGRSDGRVVVLEVASGRYEFDFPEQ